MLERETETGSVVASPLLQREAIGTVNGWLARFAPLLDSPDGLTAAECRKRVEQVPQLRSEGQQALAGLEAQAGPGEAELLSTQREALKQLDVIERDLRERIGLLAPGDAAGVVDLRAIRTKLAENAARHEIEEIAGSQPKELRITADTASPNYAAALFTGVFSFGWLSFTGFHAWFMIGGMMHQFGLLGLALLGFYSIFFLVGFAGAAAAFSSLCTEHVALEGRTFTLTRRFFGRAWNRKYEMGPESRAYLSLNSARQEGAPTSTPTVRTGAGKEVKFGANMPGFERDRLIRRLNEYLQAIG